MLSPKLLRTLSEASYALVVLLTVSTAGLSCAAVLSQAVRTSPGRDWINNFNALVIGASYLVVVSGLLLLFLKVLSGFAENYSLLFCLNSWWCHYCYVSNDVWLFV